MIFKVIKRHYNFNIYVMIKKFSNISGVKVNPEPTIEPSKENGLDGIKSAINKLMDDFLSIRSYGSVSPVWRVPIKIAGKEMFIDALIDLISDKSLMDQLTLLESLKTQSRDWVLIDEKIDNISNTMNESIISKKLESHVSKIEKMLELYSDMDNFNEVLERYISRIKNGENAYWRGITADQMINNPKFSHLSKSKLKQISERYLFRSKQLGFNK
jgi:hypothetical protein